MIHPDAARAEVEKIIWEKLPLRISDIRPLTDALLAFVQQREGTLREELQDSLDEHQYNTRSATQKPNAECNCRKCCRIRVLLTTHPDRSA